MRPPSETIPPILGVETIVERVIVRPIWVGHRGHAVESVIVVGDRVSIRIRLSTHASMIVIGIRRRGSHRGPGDTLEPAVRVVAVGRRMILTDASPGRGRDREYLACGVIGVR